MSIPHPKFWQICTRFAGKLTARYALVHLISHGSFGVLVPGSFTFVRFFDKIDFSFKKLYPQFQDETNQFLLFHGNEPQKLFSQIAQISSRAKPPCRTFFQILIYR